MFCFKALPPQLQNPNPPEPQPPTPCALMALIISLRRCQVVEPSLSLLPPHPRSPELPLRATSGAREIPPAPPALPTNTEPHRHFETAADGGPFLDVSLKNHLRQHLYSAPSPPVSHPYLGRRATLINIHHPPEWRRRWVGGWLDGSGGGECEDALPSVPLHPPSTKGPQANGVHPRQPPRRDHRAADEIIKAALGLKAGPIIPHHRNHRTTTPHNKPSLPTWVDPTAPWQAALCTSTPPAADTQPLKVAGCLVPLASRLPCVSSTSQPPNWHLGFRSLLRSVIFLFFLSFPPSFSPP